MTSLGFTGSSDDGMPTALQEKTIFAMLVKFVPKQVHHGDCINSDARFNAICNMRIIPPEIHIHPPDNPKKRAWCIGDIMYEEKPYMKRNQDIVNASGVLIATPHGPEVVRSGTWATIRRARKKGIPIYIVYPNGKVEQES